MSDKPPRTKEQVVADIAHLVGAPAPPSAHGAREPKAILVIVNERLGLGFDDRLSKPELAQAIVQSAGLSWTPDCWSRPQTLTKLGLERLEQAVERFLEPL